MKLLAKGFLLVAALLAANLSNAQTYYLESQGNAPYPYDPYGGSLPIETIDASKKI